MMLADTYKVNAEAITLDCEHRFCKNCLHELIINLSKEGKHGVDDIVCSCCNATIDFNIIKNCAPEISEKINDESYLFIDINKLLDEKEKLVNCAGIDCPEKFDVVINKPFPVYPICKTAFCINGKSCEQYQQEKMKARSQEEKGLVFCPRCKVQIFKDGGCNIFVDVNMNFVMFVKKITSQKGNALVLK